MIRYSFNEELFLRKTMFDVNISKHHISLENIFDQLKMHMYDVSIKLPIRIMLSSITVQHPKLLNILNTCKVQFINTNHV